MRGMTIDLGNPISDHPLNRGRVLWLYGIPQWSGGGTWFDLCRRHNGTLTLGGDPGSRPTWTPTPYGSGLSFATDDFVTVAGPTGAFPGSEAAVTFWVKLREQTPAAAGDTGLAQIGVNDNTHYPWTNGTLYVALFDTVRNINGAADSGDRTQWRRWCLTTQAGTDNYRLYFDGRLLTTATRSGFSVANDFLFGGNNLAHRLNGWLADIGIWSGVPLGNPDSFAWADYDQARRGHPDTLRRVPRRRSSAQAAAAAFQAAWAARSNVLIGVQ